MNCFVGYYLFRVLGFYIIPIYIDTETFCSIKINKDVETFILLLYYIWLFYVKLNDFVLWLQHHSSFQSAYYH